METTNFKKEGFWYFLYRLNYKTELPPDTCTYKRGLIISIFTAIVLFPLTILRLVYRLIIKKTSINEKLGWEPIYGLTGYLPPFALIVLPLLFGSVVLGKEQTNLLLIWVVGFIILIMICVVFGVIIYGIMIFVEWRKDVKMVKRQKIKEQGNNPDEKSSFDNLYDSWKEKLCKKIKWEGEDDDEYINGGY